MTKQVFEKDKSFWEGIRTDRAKVGSIFLRKLDWSIKTFLLIMLIKFLQDHESVAGLALLKRFILKPIVPFDKGMDSWNCLLRFDLLRIFLRLCSFYSGLPFHAVL